MIDLIKSTVNNGLVRLLRLGDEPDHVVGADEHDSAHTGLTVGFKHVLGTDDVVCSTDSQGA